MTATNQLSEAAAPDPTVCSYLRGAIRVVEATEGRITSEGRRIVKATHIVINPELIASGRVSHQVRPRSARVSAP